MFIAKKRKAGGKGGEKKGGAKFAKKNVPKKRKENDDDDVISSESESDVENDSEQISEDEEEEEIVEDKKIRLAKKYLQEIKEQERDRGEFEEGAITKRLQDEYLEEQGRLRKTLASNYTGHGEVAYLSRNHHSESITCLCISTDGEFLYSGSKDGTLVKWSLSSRKKVNMIKRKISNDKVLKIIRTIAVSSDNKFLVLGESGTKDIMVFSGDDLKHLKNLQGHRDKVSGLAFRKDTHTLYSASDDRSVKVWNLDDMAYVETVYGHQSKITSIDALSRERAITSGGCDNSIRIWKFGEESQLIFNGHSGNIDAVKLINEEHFLSCGDDGQICLWGAMKKKPIFTVPLAHGRDESNGEPLWISSIATFLNTDLVASGSSDGAIKVWKCGENFKNLEILFEIQVVGFANSLLFTPDGSHLIAGIGKEHKLGRWSVIKEAKNGIVVIPLIRK